MGKIAESFKSDYEIALTRESSIKQSLESAVSDSRLTNRAQVQLTELESNASTTKLDFADFIPRSSEAHAFSMRQCVLWSILEERFWHTVAWLGRRCCSLAKDFEETIANAIARIFVAGIRRPHPNPHAYTRKSFTNGMS